MSKIHLHIEQLSLPGYTPAERSAFIAALERELASRVSAPGARQELQSGKQGVLRVNSPDMRPQSVARSAAIGLPLGKEIKK
jgi:hypothetical protein